MKRLLVSVVLSLPLASHAQDFQAAAKQLREQALSRISGSPIMTPSRPVVTDVPRRNVIGTLFGVRYPWKQNIVTTVFWIGEDAISGGGIANRFWCKLA